MGNLCCRPRDHPDHLCHKDPWYIQREDYTPLMKVGKGIEGTITLVKMINSTPKIIAGQVVVLKELNPHVSVQSYENEVSILKQLSELNHPNIIRMLGVSAYSPKGIFLEYMPLGNLLEHVSLCSTVRDNLTLARCLHLLYDVAKGMSALEKCHLIHRDLAARNCLVSSNETVKISDFGMSRMLPENACYYQSDEVMMPIRWSPPETIQSGIHYLKSDVWSYGVVVWEVFSEGKDTPYGAHIPNREVAECIIKGRVHLSRPEKCPEDIWDMLYGTCCSRIPGRRPWFRDIVNLYEKNDVIKNNLSEFAHM